MMNSNVTKSSVTTVLVLWLSCISLSSALAASTICRNALYLAAMISLVDFFIKKTRLQFNQAILIMMIALLLSISIYLPTVLHSSSTFHDIDMNYRETAKRLFLGVIIGSYLISHRDKISSRGWNGAYFWIFIGFIYTIIVAFKLSVPNMRLEIKTVATMTAYVFAVLALAATYIALKTKGWVRVTSVLVITFLSIYILLLTQTRSVLLTYPILLLVILIKERFFTKRNSLLFLITLILSTFILPTKFDQAIKRIDRSIIEYKEYQKNNDSTSLGSRFSMWKAGFSTNTISLLGKSADQRDILVRKYIKKYENNNHEALRVIKYHYHNDLLEAGTLRGVIGFAILLLFYFFTISASKKFTGNFNTTLFLITPTILYGSSDSLLIDHRYTTILILLIPFYLCSDELKSKDKTEKITTTNK